LKGGGKLAEMIERPDVDALMAGPLGNWLDGQAIAREAALKATNNRRFGVVLVVLVLAVFALILFRIELGTVLAGTFFVGAAGWAWAEGPKRKAILAVKIGINDAIAEALGMEYHHDCEAGLPFELAKACRLVPSHDRASFEDSWSGHFGEIPFMLHEAHLEERRGSGKNRRWVTVFRGLIMDVGYTRRFHGTTLLVRDNFFRKIWGSKKDSIKVAGLTLDYAAMVHPDFEDIYDIYTSDQTEARYLIDPLYVEQLIALERSYEGQDAATIFHEGHLVIALKSGNLFESGSIDASDDRARMMRTIDQFENLARLAAMVNSRHAAQT